MKALVLSGGGARGAYQVGVLKAVAEISEELKIEAPFQIITGISAGAINAACLSWGVDRFPKQVRFLESLWSQLTPEQVFHTDIMSMGKIGFKWMGELSLGALTGASGKSLLDTAPLRALIDRNMDWDRVDALVESGHLRALALSAMDYRNSHTVTFVQGGEGLPDWQRNRRYSLKTQIRSEHVMASSAIPLLFPPIKVADAYYGDGCVRSHAPLSPAIHLGASSVFVIGVRKMGWTADSARGQREDKVPSVARVVNMVMNSVLLDGIEVDVERLLKINQFLEKVPTDAIENLNFRPMDVSWVYPTEDIGHHAHHMSSRLPRIIRYLLKGLGPLEDASELISYLLFDPDFCKKLIEFGYADGLAKADDIRRFLKA
ncbi:MAG: patatin-like phospholipase family protein [Bdellovibrionaceae bacterium]|nr:patatin-like phospholipase family protein [Pseudobdellovibrionaceae bacterium]